LQFSTFFIVFFGFVYYCIKIKFDCLRNDVKWLKSPNIDAVVALIVAALGPIVETLTPRTAAIVLKRGKLVFS